MASVEQLGLAASAAEALLSAVAGRADSLPFADQAAAGGAGAGDGGGGVLSGRALGIPSGDALDPGGTLVGTALVAGGAGALNQWLERERDARMRRTAGRALPSGRICCHGSPVLRRVDRGRRQRDPARGSGNPGRVGRVPDVRAVRLHLHAAEDANDAEHVGGCDAGCIAAADRLGGGGRDGWARKPGRCS